MSLSFPSSPSVGQLTVTGGQTWRWTGTTWTIVGNSGYQGSLGYQGSAGATGPISGSNTQVLFNDSSFANGSPSLTFNKSTNTTYMGVTSVNTSLTVNNTFTANATGVFITNPYGPQITLNGATSNYIAFNNADIGTPSFSTPSVGTRLQLYAGESGSSADIAVGTDGTNMWLGVSTGAGSFNFYEGTYLSAQLNYGGLTLYGGGILNTSFLDTGSSASIFYSNVSIGAAGTLPSDNAIALVVNSAGSGLSGGGVQFTANNNGGGAIQGTVGGGLQVWVHSGAVGSETYIEPIVISSTGVTTFNANLSVNAASYIVVGNATTNTVINSTSVSINGSVLVSNTYATNAYVSNAFYQSAAVGVSNSYATASLVSNNYAVTALVGNSYGTSALVGNNFLSTGTTVTINAPTIKSPIKFSSVSLGTATAGYMEYDGTYLYGTENATSGRGHIPTIQTFRVTANETAFGAAIADVFTSPSSVSLEATSVYIIRCWVYFTKNTAGTATWTQTFSSAPTIVNGYQYVTPVTGMTAATAAAYTQIEQYFYDQGAATWAWNPSATSLTTAVNHMYMLQMWVTTNAATNWRLRLTQSAGTATVLAGSFYTVEKISISSGAFAA